MLAELDDAVYVEVFLEGEMNAAFKRFQKNIRETLDEFRVYSGNRLQYTFTDPATALSQKARSEFMNELISKGIQPTNVVDEKDGQRVERLLFPGAIISYAGAEIAVNLFKGGQSASLLSKQEIINQAVEKIEFELASAIYKLSNAERKSIGWLQGHGELGGLETASIMAEMESLYDVNFIGLQSAEELQTYDVLVLARPLKSFNNREKFLLDQYLMRGGKLLMMLNAFQVNIDSASADQYFPPMIDHSLDDMLFRYGLRINKNMVQDRLSTKFPVVTGMAGSAPQMQMLDWYFFPLINNYPAHLITRNLDAVQLRFASSIDTVKATGVNKMPLMLSSPYMRLLNAPVNVSANELRNTRINEMQQPVALAYLLEGNFTSVFKNRFLPEGFNTADFKGESLPTKMIVVADGDLARNDINARTNQAQPLGKDPYAAIFYANQDFIMNALAYLTASDGLITTRNKEIKIRPLDKQKIAEEKLYWQLLNLISPVLLIVLFGVLRAAWRKRKFGR